MWSYWERSTFIGQPDLLVIGSGIVGLNAAIEYAHRHPRRQVLVLEAGPLPAGASTKNAGFACFGSPTELLDDLQHNPPEQVLATLDRRWRGLLALKRVLGDREIGYEDPGSHELFLDEAAPQYEATLNELDRLNDMIAPVLGWKPYRPGPHPSEFKFQGMAGAIRIQGEGQIDTGMMMQRLLELARHRGVRVLNGIAAEKLESREKGVIVNTSEGAIFARHCLVATNGFARQFYPQLDLQPARAQVLITHPIPGLQLSGTFHLDEGYYYFRNVGERILLGGGRNLDFAGERTTQKGLSPKIQDALDTLLHDRILPGQVFLVAQRWTGIMGVGKSKAPIVEAVAPHVHAAVRLGGMGIAIGTLVGQEAVDLIVEAGA